MLKDVEETKEPCVHCKNPIHLVTYRWSKGDRLETQEPGVPLGEIHSANLDPPIIIDRAKLCAYCDGGVVQRAMTRK